MTGHLPVRAALLLALSVALAAPCSADEAAAPASAPHWALQMPQDAVVPFHGETNYDRAGKGAGTMMYPAPNALGFLAGVLTHGILNSATRSHEKNAIQEAADKVLIPYQDVLKEFKTSELLQRSFELASAPGKDRVLSSAEKPGDDLLVATAPQYSMTQDQSALVLDQTVAVYRPEAPKQAYQLTVRVVSDPVDTSDPTHYWTEGSGKPLKERSAELLAESLDLALRMMGSAPVADEQRTIHYMQGKTEKMERATVLKADCRRLLIRNLRGWLMSVPRKPGSELPGFDLHCQ